LSSAVLICHSIKLNLTKNKKKLSRNSFFIVAIASVFVVLYVSSCLKGIEQSRIQARRVNGAAFCLTYPEVASEQSLKILYPDPNVVRSRIKTLSELGIKFDR
jgi:hypothetical protein